MGDIATGRVSMSDVRELDIYDLLGREQVKPDEHLMKLNTSGKTVLVTGAGGSIGAELCRQILETNPKQLLLLEMSEFALYQIHQELLRRHRCSQDLSIPRSAHRVCAPASTARW